MLYAQYTQASTKVQASYTKENKISNFIIMRLHELKHVGGTHFFPSSQERKRQTQKGYRSRTLLTGSKEKKIPLKTFVVFTHSL